MDEPNRGLQAATKRYRTLKRADFRKFIGELRQELMTLETLEQSVPENGVRVDGATKGERAMDLLRDYTFLVNEATTNR